MDDGRIKLIWWTMDLNHGKLVTDHHHTEDCGWNYNTGGGGGGGCYKLQSGKVVPVVIVIMRILNHM